MSGAAYAPYDDGHSALIGGAGSAGERPRGPALFTGGSSARYGLVGSIGFACVFAFIAIIMSGVALQRSNNSPASGPSTTTTTNNYNSYNNNTYASSTTNNYIAAPSLFPATITVNLPNIAVEGAAWDSIGQRFVLGSIAFGNLYEVLPGAGMLPGGTGVAPAARLAMALPGLVRQSIAGVFVDTSGGRYVTWGALARFPPDASQTVQGGLVRVDMVTGAVVSVDTTPFRSSAALKMLINDVVVDPRTGVVYATDSFEGILLRGEFQPASQTIAVSVLINDARLANPNGPFGGIGLNGIEYYNGSLLAGISGRAPEGGMWLVPIDNPTAMVKVNVTNGPGFTAEGIDGLRFNADRTVLYVTNALDQRVSMLVSSDGWRTAQVTATWCVPATAPVPISTLAYVPGVEAVYAVCTAQFGAGPYQLVRADWSMRC
jgi:hypothetical protein